MRAHVRARAGESAGSSGRGGRGAPLVRLGPRKGRFSAWGVASPVSGSGGWVGAASTAELLERASQAVSS